MYTTRAFSFLLLQVFAAHVNSETCGQDRVELGNWFIDHGSTDLLLPPYPPLVRPVVRDPYRSGRQINPPQNRNPREVCGMQWSSKKNHEGKNKYRLRNFYDESAAKANNYIVTHKGHCGACSYLQDLGVYMRTNLTAETRHCALLSIASPDLMRDCLLDLGFTLPCITIWEWNILNTRRLCMKTCLLGLITQEPFNRADGTLNECIQCDEDKSVPIYKYYAGRTRRTSGITSAIWRPPGALYNIEHCYWYGPLRSRYQG